MTGVPKSVNLRNGIETSIVSLIDDPIWGVFELLNYTLRQMRRQQWIRFGVMV